MSDEYSIAGNFKTGKISAAEYERKMQRELDHQSEEERNLRERERLHDTDPGRWPEWASPARMRRDLERDREEERDR